MAAILALTVAVGWRLWGLDARCLWFDEAFSWQLTRFSWGEMIERAQADVHPPFYYVLLKLWTDAFGASAYALRLLSVAWFAAALLAGFLLCREADARPHGEAATGAEPARTRGADCGLIAMLLLATSPFLFRYSQEARMYTQMIALSTLSSWLLLRALREGGPAGPWWGAYGVAAAGLGYTHYYGLFTVAGHAAFVLGLLLATSRDRSASRWRRRTACGALGAAVLATALYLPWLPTLRRQQEQVSRDYWARSVDADPPVSVGLWRSIALDCMVHNNGRWSSPFSGDPDLESALGYGLLAGSGLVLGVLARRGDRVGWCVVAGVVVPVVLAVVQCFLAGRNLIGHRYLMPSYVLLLIGLALVLGRLRRRALGWLLAAGACLNLAFLTNCYQESLGLPERSDVRGAADYIAGRRGPGDVVLCLSPMDFFPMKYHALGRFEVRQARYPGLAVKHYTGGPIFQEGDFFDWQELARGRVRRAWVIRRGSDPSTPGKPDGWRRLDGTTFDEPLRFRGPVLLDLWESPAGRPGESRTRESRHPDP
jgi:hypothetical protein